jgi:hypothetical protein
MQWGENNFLWGLLRKHEGNKLLRRKNSILMGLKNRTRGHGMIIWLETG